MALKATIRKLDLQISDIDRNYYQDHSLTLAQHPSETDERMMLRVLSFAMFADPALSFTKGLSSQDEPDLWSKSLSGEIELWIDLGCPDESRIKKACGVAKKVVIVTYSGNTPVWWNKIKANLKRFKNLTVVNLQDKTEGQLSDLVSRAMDLNCTIQDGQVWLNSATDSLLTTPETLFPEE
ncbi:MAG: hypothetical protein COB04_07310 [Gammaproteobacteria bacterium]|nr:MAG: hypothetical protein COB04_07310 [Gammaproteobacteria bacterium]